MIFFAYELGKSSFMDVSCVYLMGFWEIGLRSALRNIKSCDLKKILLFSSPFSLYKQTNPRVTKEQSTIQHETSHFPKVHPLINPIHLTLHLHLHITSLIPHNTAAQHKKNTRVKDFSTINITHI